MIKKILFIAMFVSTIAITAQNRIGLGINGGIPIGNLEDNFSVAFGFDANYLFDVTDQISIGGATGMVFFSGKENNGVTPENKIHIPIAAAFRFNNDMDKWFVQGDFGYAIGISPSGDRGGFYFKPILGYNFNDSFGLNLFYTGIKKKYQTFSYIGLGAMVRL